jgi:hypothetical protein
MSNNKYSSWNSTGAAAKKIKEQFDLFAKTNGEAGIDPELIQTPADAREQVYNHPKLKDILKVYNPTYFCRSHCRNLKAAWKLGKSCDRARAGTTIEFN